MAPKRPSMCWYVPLRNYTHSLLPVLMG